MATQQDVAAGFGGEPRIAVSTLPVSESDLGTGASGAFAAGDLPDVMNYALPVDCLGSRQESLTP